MEPFNKEQASKSSITNAGTVNINGEQVAVQSFNGARDSTSTINSNTPSTIGTQNLPDGIHYRPDDEQSRGGGYYDANGNRVTGDPRDTDRDGRISLQEELNGPAPTEGGLNPLIRRETDGEGNITYVNEDDAGENPREAQAVITRSNYEYAKEFFQPLEGQLAERALSSVEPEAQRAGSLVERRAAQAEGEFNRDLSRRGITLTDRQQTAFGRRRKLETTTGVANAENTTRRDLKEERLYLQGDLIALGQNIENEAIEDLRTASALQTQRELSNAQQEAQRKQSKSAGAAAGATAGSAAGPWGAVIGAVVGYLVA